MLQHFTEGNKETKHVRNSSVRKYINVYILNVPCKPFDQLILSFKGDDDDGDGDEEEEKYGEGYE